MNKKISKKLIRVTGLHSPDTEKNILYVLESGFLPSEFTHPISRTFADVYLIAVILNGEGIVSYEGIDYPIREGQGFFLYCNTEHGFRFSSKKPWDVMWLYFNGVSAGYYYEKFRQHSCCLFYPDSIGEYTTIIHEIIANNSHTRENSEIINAKLITDILTLILSNPCSQKSDNSGKSVNYQIRSVMEYVDTHFTENINLDDLASAFYMNKYHLAREFKREYGETVFQHIINKKISYAKELMVMTDKSIEEIALICGFNDRSYFSRQFKKIVGKNCLSYRKENKRF